MSASRLHHRIGIPCYCCAYPSFRAAIPKAFGKDTMIDWILTFDYIKDIPKFCSVATSRRCYELVFKWSKILYQFSEKNNGFASYYDLLFAIYRVNAEHGFLYQNTDQFKDLAIYIFTDTSVCVTHFFLVRRGGNFNI